MLKRKLWYLVHVAGYVIKEKLSGEEKPFIGGLVLTEQCNLRCLQCKLSRDLPDLSYEEARQGLRVFYDMGIRSVFIKGGETFLWKDNEKSLEDVVILARKMGFRSIAVYTNGTFPIKTSADTVYISLDGLRETHDSLRGESFTTALANINASASSDMRIYFTINKINSFEIEAFCDSILKIKKIKGMFFSFYTPYHGIDDLFLDPQERKAVIARIIRLKRRYRKIQNPYVSLRAALDSHGGYQSKISYVYAHNTLYQCCRYHDNKEACAHCGNLGVTGIKAILSLTSLMEPLFRAASLIIAVLRFKTNP